VLNRYFLLLGSTSGLLLVGSLTPAQAQAPIITSITPTANSYTVPRTSSVVASFSQPLTPASASALKVFSSQRGGLRGGGTATVAGSTLTFAPTGYDFRPGELVNYTVTRAAASSGGVLAQARVGQFRTAVSGAGAGNFQIGSEVSAGNRAGSVALSDVDNDGDLDILVANYGGSSVSVRLNNGSGTFSGTQDVGVNARPFNLTVGDVDGDGDVDLLTASETTNTVSVRLNNGSGVFSGTQNVSVGDFPRLVTLGDVDGDGDLDFVTANYGNASTVSVCLNNGGQFTRSQTVAVGTAPCGVTLGDVDNDGDLDLLTANNGTNTVSVRLNNGTGSFSGNQEVAVYSYPSYVTVGDIDGDGDLDLLASAGLAGMVSVRLNNGAGIFSGTQLVSVSGVANCLALGDVDGDGDLDLLTANNTSLVNVRLNSGAGIFSGSQMVEVGYNPISVALGDVDGDGDLDFVTGSYGTTQASDNAVSVRLNGSVVLAATNAQPVSALTLAPNPAHSQVQLQGLTKGAHVNIYDALGRLVRTPMTTTLDVTDLPAGLYLVRATTPSQLPQTARLLVE
jgi:hypothetical protein